MADTFTPLDYLRQRFDSSGRLLGLVDKNGTASPIVLQDSSTGSLIGPDGAINFGSAGLSGAVYDGSNRVTNYTLNGIDYTVSGWGGTTITVSGSDGTVREITLDGSGRISGVA